MPKRPRQERRFHPETLEALVARVERARIKLPEGIPQLAASSTTITVAQAQ